jgi:energy-converting hydrogenase B subunit D
MSALQTTALIAVVVAGTAVVFAPDPLRQTMILGIYGVTLTILFFVVQAPDVALSEIVVSGVGLPVIILAALRKIRSQEREREAERDS